MLKLISKIRKSLFYRLDKNAWTKDNFKSGFETFLKTGVTPEESYKAMINLYCLTNGTFTENLNSKIIFKAPPVAQKMPLEGVIGNISGEEFSEINKTLNADGYVFFNKKLDAKTIAALNEFALTTPATIPPAYDKRIIYNSAEPLAEIYRFKASDMMNNKDIQKLIMDPVLINIARNYLQCEPIFDFPAMWWSTSFLKQASEEAAQLYHFDMDRVKWLKIFIYLNDVTPQNGPHCYIRGTHKPGSKPMEILKKGYVRIPDKELTPFYKPEDFKEISAEAGTIFAGDTLCFHKGKSLLSGHRLVLELEYTSSLFGTNYGKLEVTNADREFKDFCDRYKTYASNIQFKN